MFETFLCVLCPISVIMGGPARISYGRMEYARCTIHSAEQNLCPSRSLFFLFYFLSLSVLQISSTRFNPKNWNRRGVIVKSFSRNQFRTRNIHFWNMILSAFCCLTSTTTLDFFSSSFGLCVLRFRWACLFFVLLSHSECVSRKLSRHRKKKGKRNLKWAWFNELACLCRWIFGWRTRDQHPWLGDHAMRTEPSLEAHDELVSK